jgi:hypothetical protein
MQRKECYQNHFEASITLIPKLDKDETNKVIDQFP